MDCKLARERLDAARPDARDREDAELQAAFSHFDECADCARAVEFHHTFDRRLGAIVRAVEVPADLQTRLLAKISDAEPAPQPGQQPLRPPLRRRTWLAVSSAAALLLAAVGLWWLMQPRPQLLAATTVLDWCRTNLAQAGAAENLPEFNGRFDPAVADGRWVSRLADAPPRGADVDGDGRQDLAVYPITGGGYLVVLPPDRVSDPPAAASALSATARYAPAPHVAWTLGKQMYVCLLPGGNESQLRSLLQQVYSAAA